MAFVSPVFSADALAHQTNAQALVEKGADAVLRDFAEPPPFDWGEGVLLTGMMRAYELTRDGRSPRTPGSYQPGSRFD